MSRVAVRALDWAEQGVLPDAVIRAIPAGREMKVRMTGRRRLRKTVASPYLPKNRSAASRSLWRRRM